MRKGTKVCEPTGDAPDETSVPLGDGMIDTPDPALAEVPGVGAIDVGARQPTKISFTRFENIR